VAAGWLLGVVQAVLEGISYGLAGRAVPWHAMTWNWLSYGVSALLLPWLVARAQANPFTRERWPGQLAALLGRVLTAVAIEATLWLLLRKGYEWAGGKPYDLTLLWRGLLDGFLLSNVYLFTAF
jgi:hypothetical protein